MLWRGKWPPTPVSLPEKSHGQRSLVGYSPWGPERVGRNLVTKQPYSLLQETFLNLFVFGDQASSYLNFMHCVMHKHHINVVSVGLLPGTRGFSASIPPLSFWKMQWMTAFSHNYLPPGKAVFFPERQFASREYKRNLGTLISNRAPQSMTFHLMNITWLQEKEKACN